MPELRCTECGWSGDFSEAVNDCHEDSDGDLVGEYLDACPECHAPTVDEPQFDDGDLSDTYAS